MKEYSVSVVRADESYGYATITYSEASTVTVEITGINSAGSSWRIRGRASLGDNTTYLSGNGLGTYTFKSDNNKSYIFQIQNWNNDWVNTTNAYGEEVENSIFDVVFESDSEDSGDDSGSGGGSSGDWYGTAHCNASSSMGSLSAVVNWDSGPEVTVEVICNAYWRLINRNSGEVIFSSSYNFENNPYIATFNANDGEVYTFQIEVPSWEGEWSSSPNGSFTVDFYNGGSGSGGNSGSTSNSSVYPESVAQNGVTAYLSISGSTVTVEVSRTDLFWRINGTNSGGDHGTYYIEENKNSSGSFTAEDDHTYAFQVCSSSGNWSDGDFFTVSLDSGGDSGDDNGGGSGDSGGNTPDSSLKEYTFTALGVTAKATYTSGPDVTITILSWDGYNSIPYWRIKGVKSEGDDNTYLGQNNKSSNSFDSKDVGYGDGYDDGGKNYIFQVCKNGNWNNDGGSSSKFNVDFSIDSGGSSGGSGSSTPCGYLIINQGEGTKLHVRRSWPPERTCWEDLKTGEPIYMDGEDTFFVYVEALDGYEIDYYLVDGMQVGYQFDNFIEYEPSSRPSGDTNIYYQVATYGNVTVTSTATPIATANIYSNSKWNRYYLNIYSNSEWNKYAPYIYKNSQWERYR